MGHQYSLVAKKATSLLGCFRKGIATRAGEMNLPC